MFNVLWSTEHKTKIWNQKINISYKNLTMRGKNPFNGKILLQKNLKRQKSNCALMANICTYLYMLLIINTSKNEN